MRKLSMPAKISLEKAYFPGITKRELFPLLISTLPGIIVVIVLWAALTDPLWKIFSLVGGILYIALCYMVFARLEGSQSIYQFLSRIVRYNRSQHQYYYKHGKEEIHFVGEETR